MAKYVSKRIVWVKAKRIGRPPRRYVNVGKVCANPVCNRGAEVKGFCTACYSRWRKSKRK